MLARTARASTRRFSIQVWLSAWILTRMLVASLGSDLESSGRLTSRPASLMKDATKMKKMSMMNTTSSMGVRSISAPPSSLCLASLRIGWVPVDARSVIGRQLILKKFLFPVRDAREVGVGEQPGKRRHHAGHGRDGGTLDTTRH